MTTVLHTKDWAALAAQSRRGKRLAGFYNENYACEVDGTKYLFRFPKKGEAQMDPRPMKETALLSILAQTTLPLPGVIYIDPAGEFYVEAFLNGDTLEKTHPPGSRVPAPVMDAIPRFYGQLARLHLPDVTPILSADWPTRGPGLTFFEKLLEKAWMINDEHRVSHGRYYDFIGLPADPYSAFLARGSKLTPRPWRLLHADLHRGNILHGAEGVFVIDWELALYGDLLYCVAAHLHRMRYHPQEKTAMAASIKSALPDEFQKNYEQDLEFYLDYEALKSIITDTVRFPDLIQNQNLPAPAAMELCVYYTDNLNRLSPLLGNKTAKPEQALDWFYEWAV